MTSPSAGSDRPPATPGRLARRLLGPWFEPFGNFYRGLFMDLGKMADRIAAAIPPGAMCLDIGGGDGMVANALLARRPDIAITMIDLAPQIGSFIDPGFSHRIDMHPATPLNEFTEGTKNFDAVLITDVLHHIPVGARPHFFADLKRQMTKAHSRVLIVKEVAPGRLRSWLGVLSDKYVTGDRNVALLSEADIRHLVENAFGTDRIESFAVEMPDPPNYFVVIRLSGTPQTA